MKPLTPSLFTGVLLMALGSGACGKKPAAGPAAEGAGPEPATANETPATAAVPQAPKTPPPPPEANTDQTLQWLNKVVHDYVMWKKVVPRDLNEVVGSGMISGVPTPPAGKRYMVVLRPLGYRVELVDE